MDPDPFPSVDLVYVQDGLGQVRKVYAVGNWWILWELGHHEDVDFEATHPIVSISLGSHAREPDLCFSGKTHARLPTLPAIYPYRMSGGVKHINRVTATLSGGWLPRRFYTCLFTRWGRLGTTRLRRLISRTYVLSALSTIRLGQFPNLAAGRRRIHIDRHT